jgi:uncharacterized protein YecE (DUF72 family)
MTIGLGYFRHHGRGGYRYRHTDTDLAELLGTAQGQETCDVPFNNISMREEDDRFLKLT